MNVKQISTMLNSVFSEVMGEGVMISEDLRNLVDVGRTITSSTDFENNFENYAGKIVDKVGRTIFVDRTYKATDLGLWRDSFEYGSVLEKLRVDVGNFTDNAEWDLTKDTDSDGDLDYNENISTHIQDLFKFNPARVQAKYWNAKATFKATISITRKQMRSAFTSASKMARFIGMIENRITSKLEIAKAELQKRTLANMIGEKIYNVKFVDLREQYINDTGVTAASRMSISLNDAAVLRYIAKRITQDRDLMTEPSTLYTDGTFYNHTPIEDSRLIVLSDLDKALAFNLYSGTYNEQFVKLGNYKTIPFWQMNAKELETRAAVKLTTSNNHAVNQGQVLGILFDRDAAMICNEEPEVRSQYNADGNFWNYFYTFDCSYYNDFDENVIVYTWGDITLAAITGTLEKGTNSGTTAITATATAGGSLYCAITDKAINVVPGAIFDVTDSTVWTALTSGTKKDNLAATAGDIITVIEVDANGMTIATKQATITASYIK